MPDSLTAIPTASQTAYASGQLTSGQLPSAPIPTPAPQPTPAVDTSSFTPAQLSAYNAAKALIPPAPTVNQNPHDQVTAIPITSISNPVNPPANTATPPPINATAPSLADNFNSSLSSTLTTQQQQLQAAYKAQQDTYQQKIDAAKQEAADAKQAADFGLSMEGSAANSEAQDKAAALEQEQQQFKQNFDARQKLTDQLQTLLQQGQDTINNLKATSGLSTLMNPRISQTMTDVQGQAGVISTALAAYDSQIGLAQSQLKTATDAITSIYSDQITYYKNVVDFYSSQAKDDNAQVASLSKDQQAYIDAQIKTLQDNVSTVQANAQMITKAMLDPTTALTYAKAGVSLTDTPAQINQKLALQAQADANVWGAPKLVGGDYIQTNKLTGETRTVVSNATNATPALNTVNSKGQLSNKQFVELSLERAKIDYQTALSKVPAGKVGVVDNATGQIGYIDPTEYNTKQYTYL